MKHCLRSAALAAVLTLVATRAHAQITTVIAGPKRADTAVLQQAARVEQAAQDSIARVTLTGMTQWVDSAAAALALRPDTGTAPQSDTARAPARTSPPPQADSATRARSRDSVGMRDGARAPNTATPFPTIALGGIGMILIGLVMRRRPRTARARGRT